jgi:hypothetical protein
MIRNEEVAQKLLALFGGLILVVSLYVGGVILNGWAVSVLWSWFIVPTFGLPLLTIPKAIGLVVIINYFFVKASDIKPQKRDWKEIGKQVLYMILKPAVVLSVAYIVTRFM